MWAKTRNIVMNSLGMVPNCTELIVQFSYFQTGVPQEFLKHAIPDYLVRGTDLLSLRLSNKKMTTGNTATAIEYK